MKKTLTANIAGTVFHIEEDAYEQLQRYLAGIRANFSGSAGADEIMSDIEARIAELFSERLQGRDVVMLTDVDHVKSVMGQPEDFAGEGSGAGPAAGGGTGATTERKHRRLLRDMDDHWVGGVISGMSAYLGTDPLWVRIAFIIVTIAGWGTPLVVYVLLWILVPPASTPAEKLEMRGEPVTVDNIKRVFDEGAEKFKQGGERVAHEAKNLGKEWKTGGFQERSQQVASGVGRFFHAVFSVLAKLIGLVLLLLGAVLAFAFVVAVMGRSSIVWDDSGFHTSSWHALAQAWFPSPEMLTWTWIGLIGLVAVPIIGLILGGFRLLFDLRTPHWFGWILTPVWVASIVVLAITGTRQFAEFSDHEHVTDEVSITQPAGRTLLIATAHDPYFGDGIEHYSNGLELIDLKGDEIRYGWADLDVKPSSDSLFHLEVKRAAYANTTKEATMRARNIRYQFTQQDSLLSLAPFYTVDSKDKLRGHSVSWILHVPTGASIHFERGSGRIIHNIANTSDTYDSDMVGRTWTMTEHGLTAGSGPIPPAPKRVVQNMEKREDRRALVAGDAPYRVEVPGLLDLLSASIRL